MMSSTVVGHKFDTPVSMAGYPLKRRDENGIWQKEERFRIQTGLQGNYIPTHGSTNSEGMVINGVEINEGLEGFPGISEVALTWKYPDINSTWNGSSNEYGTTYESDATRAEKRIEEHPDWPTLSADDQTTLKGAFSTFVLVTITYRKIQKKKKSSFRFTEEEIVGNVNQTEAPSGLSGATAAKWMNYGKSIRFIKGDSVEITESWQYDWFNWKGAVTPTMKLTDIVSWVKRKK